LRDPRRARADRAPSRPPSSSPSLGRYSHAPELNDVLHLHCKGIAEVTNLEPYVGLKTLYLESNSVDVLDGLLHLERLRCLHMAKNALADVHGAIRLGALTTLDVSDNRIETLEGLRGHPSLQVLVASGNRLRDADALSALETCAHLTTLDIASNRLEDPAIVTEFFASAANLRANLKLLKLQGNPLVSEVPSYRKTVTVAMPGLNYLDDAPVFPKDRRLADAWSRGGVAEERAERGKIADEEARAREKNREAFEAMVTRAKEEAEARRKAGLMPPARDPYRHMSKRAAEEARLIREANVPEWRVDEMRAQGELPWQIEERERAQRDERRAGTEGLGGEDRAEAPSGGAEDVEDVEESESEAEASESEAEAEASESESEASSASDVAIPVAVPIDDDEVPTPGIHVAEMASPHKPSSTREDRERSPAVVSSFEGISHPEAAPDAASARAAVAEALRATGGGLPGGASSTAAAARAERLGRELARQAAAMDRRWEARGETVVERVSSKPGAEDAEEDSTASIAKGAAFRRRSPVVYGTPAYGELWARAKLIGEAREEAARALAEAKAAAAEEEEEEEEKEEEEEEEGKAGRATNREWRELRRELAALEAEENDADPFERHTVAATAGEDAEEDALFELD